MQESHQQVLDALQPQKRTEVSIKTLMDGNKLLVSEKNEFDYQGILQKITWAFTDFHEANPNSVIVIWLREVLQILKLQFRPI